jgi:hypothetical protein
MKVSELTGATLDYWAAQADPRCEGLTWERREDHWAGVCDAGVAAFIAPKGFAQALRLRRQYGNGAEQYAPSLLWHQGGSIIEQSRITIRAGAGYWAAFIDAANQPDEEGETPLIAAMRAFVASRYGDEVPA